MMAGLVQDLRFAVRGLRRTPGFTAAAVATLALGIGVTTAIFSVVNALLLRPLPYREPDRIVTALHGGNAPVAPADFLDWRAQSRSYQHAAAAQFWGPTLTARGAPEVIAPAMQVTADLFAVLGVEPLLGRTFRAGDDRPGAAPAVVLSHRLWRQRFAADPHLVGQTLTLDGRGYTVIGVMPRAFEFAPFWVRKAELWTPLDLTSRAQDRRGESLRLFGRLAPGVSRDQAQAETDAIWRRLQARYPADTRADVVLTPVHDKAVGKIRQPLLVLLAAVGFVLFIACANVANLLLARSAGRRREIGIRTSLGARPARLVRQLLTESLVLALAGGAVGVLLAHGGVAALVALGPRDLPRLETVAVDGTALAVTLLVSLLTGVGFGLAPALQLARGTLSGALRDGGRGATEGRGRGVLVVCQVALALVLLTGAGLMIRSFQRLRAVDPGFRVAHLLSVEVPRPPRDPLAPLTPGEQVDEAERRRGFARELLARIRALPGVEAASAVNHVPISGDVWMTALFVEGAPAPAPGAEPHAVYRVSAPGYVQAAGLTLLRGRDFTDTDGPGAPGVALINEALARALWPHQDPLGQRIRLRDSGPNPRQIVGVVKDARQREWAATPVPELYLPYLQNPSSGLTLVLRTAGEPQALAPAVQRAIAAVDPRLPLARPQVMDQVVAEALGQPRFNLLLLNAFAALALVLAAIGIYGVIAYGVSRRTREIGIRLALGSTSGQVLRLVMGRGLRLTAVGVVLGLGTALVTTRTMAALLFEVNATDGATFAAVAAAVVAVALLATFLPARRATAIDPATALRQD
jgi:putative ABC transport system permease protein